MIQVLYTWLLWYFHIVWFILVYINTVRTCQIEAEERALGMKGQVCIMLFLCLYLQGKHALLHLHIS